MNVLLNFQANVCVSVMTNSVTVVTSDEVKALHYFQTKMGDMIHEVLTSALYEADMEQSA